MNKAQISILEEVAHANGFAVDTQSQSVFGNKNGYTICLTQMNQSAHLNLSVSVMRGGNAPDVAEIKAMTKESKVLGGCTVIGNKITIVVKNGINRKKGREQVSEALSVVTNYLRINGYENRCQNCGKEVETDAYIVKGGVSLLCDNCFNQTSISLDMQTQFQNKRSENVIAGVVGALLGSLVGVAAIVLLSQLGYVASLSGVVMGICALKGYELLAGKLSKKGIIISVILMIIMVWLAHRVDWAISVASYFSVDFFTGFRGIGQLLQEGYIEATRFYTDLILVYLFTALGAVPMIINSLKNKKLEMMSYKMKVE